MKPETIQTLANAYGIGRLNNYDRLRLRFIRSAMQGLLASTPWAEEWNHELLAETACAVADATLAEAGATRT